MKIPYVDLKAQYSQLKPQMDAKINELITNTAFIGGEEVANFSRDFAKLYAVKHCLPLANGTDALFIAMKMLGIGVGDEVITTSSSWISTSETITLTGATPIFVDVDEYHTINPELIEAKITAKTKAIIPVHLYGQMADMSEVMKIAQKNKLEVIEDCAQSHFSELDSKRAGLWGVCGTFSFYPGKNLGAYGDAGCLITNDDELAVKVKRFSNHGALKKHEHEVEGVNSRMDSIQAGVLNVKLPYILDWTQKRIDVAQKFVNGLKGIDQIELPGIRPNSVHSFHVFGILCEKRDELRKYLNENGISCQVHYPYALPLMPAYKRFGFKKSDFPKSYQLQEKELSLPIYPEISEDEINYVIEHIRLFYEG